MKDILLLGGGKNCKVVIDIIEELEVYNIVGITDLQCKVGGSILKYKIIGTDDDLASDLISAKYACVTIGRDLHQRKKIFEIGKDSGLEFPPIISKQSVVSKYSKIGSGTIVMPSATINPDAMIGKDCIINSGAIVEHDCVIGNHCHISPGAVLNGSVEVGELSHIGANATILPNIKVDTNVIVGAGSVIIKDVEENTVVAGVPAVSLRKTRED